VCVVLCLPSSPHHSSNKKKKLSRRTKKKEAPFLSRSRHHTRVSLSPPLYLSSSNARPPTLRAMPPRAVNPPQVRVGACQLHAGSAWRRRVRARVRAALTIFLPQKKTRPPKKKSRRAARTGPPPSTTSRTTSCPTSWPCSRRPTASAPPWPAGPWPGRCGRRRRRGRTYHADGRPAARPKPRSGS
jgi:hypothetical protein